MDWLFCDGISGVQLEMSGDFVLRFNPDAESSESTSENWGDDIFLPSASGGPTTLSDVIVTGYRNPYVGGGAGGGGDNDGGGWDTDYHNWPTGHGDPIYHSGNHSDPSCEITDEVGLLNPPDGAKYYIPEGVTPNYLLDAIAFLQSKTDPVSKLLEFYRMFEDPQHPHFIDFKDWGTANGPAGSVSGGLVSYDSYVEGARVTASAFEAFGNYFYGFLGVLGGIPPEVLGYAAGVTQTGNDIQSRFMGRDDARDRAHVTVGIYDALTAAGRQQFGIPFTAFSVIDTNC